MSRLIDILESYGIDTINESRRYKDIEEHIKEENTERVLFKDDVRLYSFIEELYDMFYLSLVYIGDEMCLEVAVVDGEDKEREIEVQWGHSKRLNVILIHWWTVILITYQ